MTEHYTTATEYVLAFCSKCGRTTEHGVSSNRRGRCKECPEKPPKPKPPAKPKGLFDDK